MAYSTGVPSSTQNLIDTFITWLTSQGGFTLGNTWTFSAGSTSVDSGSGTGYTARALLRNGQYLLLAWKTTSPDFLWMNSSTNNPSTGLINAQTNCAQYSQPIELGTAPIKYHMFSDGNGSHCVVEWKGGAFQHINVGHMEKYGAWVGGLYATGTYWNRSNVTGSNLYAWDSTAYHSRPFDAQASSSISPTGHMRIDYLSQKVAVFGKSSQTGNTAAGCPMLNRYAIDRAPNAYNGRAVLSPIEVWLGLEDSLSPTYWIPVGRVSNAAYINIGNLNPADTILTDWMVFPLSSKNSGGTVAAGYVNSGNYGMAYKK